MPTPGWGLRRLVAGAPSLSATRTDTGQIEVDPAELFRVFPPVASQQGAHDAVPHGAQSNATDNNALRDSALEREVKLLREMLDAMRDDRDAWRDQAGKEREERRELAQRLALVPPITVPAPEPETPAPPSRAGRGGGDGRGNGALLPLEGFRGIMRSPIPPLWMSPFCARLWRRSEAK